MNRDVFVIHSPQDGVVEETIIHFLEENGINGWLQNRDFSTSENPGEAVLAAFASARIFIVVLSAASNQCRQTQNEVQRALESGKLILPFCIGNVAPTGAMELVLKRRYCIHADGPPFERHLHELLRIVKPFAKQQSNPTELASISRTLPSPRLIKSGGAPSQAAREQMGPFQIAVKCPTIVGIDVPFMVELIVANQSTQLLELVEIGLRSETLEERPNEVIPDLAPGTQARFLFKVTPRQEGVCLLRFALQGYDTVTKFAYSASQALTVSNSGLTTVLGSGAKKKEDPASPDEI